MAATDVHKYLHTLTGRVESFTEEFASTFSSYLKEVDDDAKDFVVGMFKPGTVEDFDKSYHKKTFTTTEDPTESTAPAAQEITDPTVPAEPTVPVDPNAQPEQNSEGN